MLLICVNNMSLFRLERSKFANCLCLRHRNPLVRRTAAQYIYKCCEIMGPGKILSGIKDVTEKILSTCAQFVVDGPPDIR